MTLSRREFILACTAGTVTPPAFAVPDTTEAPVPLAIDVHTHIFNARDLQVKAFIGEVFAESVDDSPALKRFLKKLAPWIARYGHMKSPGVSKELLYLSKLSTAKPALFSPQIRTAKFEDLDRDQREFLTELATQLNNDPQLARDYEELKPAVTENALKSLVAPLRKTDARTLFSLLQLEQTTLPGRVSTDKGRVTIDSYEKLKISPRGVLSFLAALTGYRTANLLSIIDRYNLDCAVALMVDYDWPLAKGKKPAPTPVSIPEQIALMSKIALAVGGKLLPFTAYCPWRNVMENGKSLQWVKLAMEVHGFVGVKIYPPMGFYPIGNGIPGNELSHWPGNTRDEKRAFGAKLDTRLDDFFDYCVKNDIPVLTHTSHSNGVDAASNERAGPKQWKPRLERHKDLRVCFGHGGGDTQWALKDDYKWNSGFLDLVVEYDNAYLDFGFYDSFLLPKMDEQKFRIIVRRLLEEGKDKVLYGSDVSMLLMTGSSAMYREKVETGIASLGVSADLITNFLGNNAAAYLGFTGTAPRLKSYKDFFAKNGARSPDWLLKLKAK